MPLAAFDASGARVVEQTEMALGAVGRDVWPPLGAKGTLFERGRRGGTCAATKASKAATSGAKPDDSTNAWESSANILSITMRHVSTVVPWRAKTAPSIAAVKTRRPCSRRLAKAWVQVGLSGWKSAPAIATRRPPGRSRASAEDMPIGGVRHDAIDV